MKSSANFNDYYWSQDGNMFMLWYTEGTYKFPALYVPYTKTIFNIPRPKSARHWFLNTWCPANKINPLNLSGDACVDDNEKEGGANDKLGLIYQFIGTAILGYALAFTSDDTFQKESATVWNSNKDIFNSLVTQRTDIRFGVAILLIGIVIQFFDKNLSKINTLNRYTLFDVPLLPLVPLIIILVIYLIIRI